MVMIPPVITGGIGGAATGSVGVAGGSSGTATFPGSGSHVGWEDDDMSYPGSGGTQSRNHGGFDYQGKPYDPTLGRPREPTKIPVVSAASSKSRHVANPPLSDFAHANEAKKTLIVSTFTCWHGACETLLEHHSSTRVDP